jgi:hypothetical protein
VNEFVMTFGTVGTTQDIWDCWVKVTPLWWTATEDCDREDYFVKNPKFLVLVEGNFPFLVMFVLVVVASSLC